MTIRAIIGTIAVLAGFAVLERSVDATTGQTALCKANVGLRADATARPDRHAADGAAVSRMPGCRE
jgi:hypothetical protein